MNKTHNRQDIVLIVEDIAANHEVIQTFLNDIHVHCESAFDGMEAITMCSATEKDYYSLILMDINLPYLDGFQTAEKLRSMGVQAPIVAVTASGKEENFIKPAQEVFDSLLFKPFNFSEFFTAISPYIKNTVVTSLEPRSISENENAVPPINDDVCDVHKGISNMGDNPRLFQKHLNNFKHNNVDLALRIDALIKNKQYLDAAVLCHSIKGLSGMLGLTNLYEHVLLLEEILRKTPADANAPDEVSAALSDIAHDIRLVCQIQF